MYQALYRKWRPRSFEDVVSQPHITAALKNQIAAGKTAHAYLFTGSRGTGKTTCARIFAKAINCLHPKDGEPCLECEVCRAAENGTLPDVIEIDGASNSRVDDVRELREGVAYTPEMCRYKVYIIDEAHMISPAAFNALLKTMEEPPPHVKFILATTEVHKVPETIVSRCQHFDFNRIRSEDIVDRLMYIADNESFTLEKDAAAMIARLSDGGMRDALSLLDRCSAYADNITMQTVSEAAGISGRDYLYSLIEKISARDTGGAIAMIDELHGKSKDLKVLCGELLEQLRNLMLIKSADNARELVICLPEEYDRLTQIARGLTLDRIFECITFLQSTNERFARATDKRIEMEMCMVRLCCGSGQRSEPKQASGAQADGEEIAELKRQLAALANAVNSGAVIPQQTAPAEKPKPQKTQKPKKKFDPNAFTPLAEWQEILEEVERRAPALFAFLKNSAAAIEGDSFCVVVSSEFYMKKFKASNDAALLKDIVGNYYGKNFEFRLYTASTTDIQDKENPINALVKRAEELNVEVRIKK